MSTNSFIECIFEYNKYSQTFKLTELLCTDTTYLTAASLYYCIKQYERSDFCLDRTSSAQSFHENINIEQPCSIIVTSVFINVFVKYVFSSQKHRAWHCLFIVVHLELVYVLSPSIIKAYSALQSYLASFAKSC